MSDPARHFFGYADPDCEIGSYKAIAWVSFDKDESTTTIHLPWVDWGMGEEDDPPAREWIQQVTVFAGLNADGVRGSIFFFLPDGTAAGAVHFGPQPENKNITKT